MHLSVLRRATLPAVAAAVAVSGLGTDVATANPTRSAPDVGCFWAPPTNVTPATPEGNVGFPATGANVTYVLNKFTLPAGAHLVVRGTFPQARYMSFNAYYSDPTYGAGIPSDALYDQQIVPDKGSTNPFLPGAKRTPDRKRRAWTITVSGEQPPADPAKRATNTLYAGTTGPANDQPAELFYRVYVPNKNTDIVGNGGIPQATLVLADGTELTGQAACDATKVDTSRLKPNSMPNATYQALTHLPKNEAINAPGSSPMAPAVESGLWYRPVNPCHFTDPFFQAAGYPVQNCPNTPGLTQWPTKDNAYIAAYVDRRFGPASDGHNIVVLTGKMPTTPQTFRANPRFTGGTQLRYWSVCSNESLVTTAVTVDNGCLYDEQVPVDAQGNYRIVVSMPGDRPANAIRRCDTAWMNWGNGDGATPNRPTSATLILRNMLPDSSFPNAIQSVPAPGLPADVAATMGKYMPKITYMSTAQFEANRC